MGVGEKFRKIRKDNGLSQEEFAQLFHVTRQAVSNWENDLNFPELSTLWKISNTFNVPLEEFIAEEES